MSGASIVILGLSITSSWGNGHAVTYRSLVRALTRRGHRVLFLGTFYHLRYPLLGLDIVAEKTRRLMVFQTLTMPGKSVSQAADYDINFDSR